MIIVTGSGQGVGRGMANHLAKAGASVVVAEWNAEKMRRTVDELDALGVPATRRRDATSWTREQIDAMVAATVDHFGQRRRDRQQRADVPRQRADGRGRAPTTSTCSTESGVLGTLWAMQAVYPHMKAAGLGPHRQLRVVDGIVGGAGFGAYNASKEAIRGLSRTAAKEWAADGIIVNAIAPAAAPPRAVGQRALRGVHAHVPDGSQRRSRARHRPGRALPLHRRLPLPHRPDVHGRRRQVPLVVRREATAREVVQRPHRPNAGRDADWRDPWPLTGVRQGEPAPSAGVDALRADGYRVIFDVDPVDADRDTWQDHLNNGAAVRMINELRMAYVAARLTLRRGRGYPAPGRVRRGRAASCTCSTTARAGCTSASSGRSAVAARRGKAGIVEQRAASRRRAGELLAAAWFVQLLVDADGRVVDFPDWYWEMVAASRVRRFRSRRGRRARDRPW